MVEQPQGSNDKNEETMKATVTPELKERTEKAIEADRKYNEMRRKKNELMLRGKYFEAMIVAQNMDRLREQIAEEVVRKVYREKVDLRELLGAMDERDRVQIMIALNTVLFNIDMIETCVMEANEILKKYNPDHSIEMYDKLIEAGKEASRQMKYVGLYETLRKQELFADVADEITDAVFAGVEKYMRLVQEERRKDEGSKEQ